MARPLAPRAAPGSTQAKATFFCVGDNLGRYPDIARAAMAAGHRLGNHTQHHRSAWNTPRADYLAGVAECQQQLNLLGANNSFINRGLPLFRPPYGRLTWPVLRQLRPHYRVLMWSLLTRDYDPGLAPERALRLALAAYQAPATFFCVGDNLARHPDIARAALAAGHRLGNHTQHHRSAWNTPRADYLAG
ncbi:MAG: polysaccharide deacetylase family protein, partial [Hymenobacter sp.]